MTLDAKSVVEAPKHTINSFFGVGIHWVSQLDHYIRLENKMQVWNVELLKSKMHIVLNFNIFIKRRDK